MSNSDDAVEHTLVMIPECFVFKLPPRKNASGWTAAEMTEQMWTGRLKIVQRNQDAMILLTSKTDGSLFAMSRVKEGSVDKVRDSSRYFVLKIESPDGRHAFIGLAFNDRNASFDFNVALQEYQKDITREKEIVEGVKSGTKPAVSLVDFSLKEGEKIKINIGSGAKSGRRKKYNIEGGKGQGIFLAPPPGDTPSTRKSHGDGHRPHLISQEGYSSPSGPQQRGPFFDQNQNLGGYDDRSFHQNGGPSFGQNQNLGGYDDPSFHQNGGPSFGQSQNLGVYNDPSFHQNGGPYFGQHQFQGYNNSYPSQHQGVSQVNLYQYQGGYGSSYTPQQEDMYIGVEQNQRGYDGMNVAQQGGHYVGPNQYQEGYNNPYVAHQGGTHVNPSQSQGGYDSSAFSSKGGYIGQNQRGNTGGNDIMEGQTNQNGIKSNRSPDPFADYTF